MKLSFLIQLVLLLILIVGVYMIFNNSFSGRSKMIAIVVLLVLGVYIFYQLPMFKSHTEIIENPTNAKETYSIDSKELKKSDGHFALSTWVYVDDWNYKYGEVKPIISKSGVLDVNFDGYKNDLIIKLDTLEKSEVNYKSSMYNDLADAGIDVTGITPGNLECSNNFILDTSTGTYYDSNTTTEVPCDHTTMQEIVIDNVGLQKWVNIIVAVNDRTIDVYLNGKLVKSKSFSNVINVAQLNKSDVEVTKNGGFGGFVSRVQYYPHFINPQKAWSIYRAGFGDALAGTLNRYNMSVTFYEDALEKKKYWVF